MRSTNRLALLAIPALLLALSGCAGASAVAESATTPSATQVKELEGGVTQPEYEAAFQRFSDCMSESGSDLVAVEKNDYLITYSYSGEAAADGSYQRCYTAEFEQVDTEWQLANYERSETAKMLRSCLQERGIAPTEQAGDLADQAKKAGIDPNTCLSNSQ